MGKSKKKSFEGASYEISAAALSSPRAIKVNGTWVGVGGTIVREAKPPFSSVTIREATMEEYIQLAERGNPLVKKLADDFQTTESDT